MATRFYFPAGSTAAVSPTINSGGEWEHANTVRGALLTTADSSTLATTAYTPDAADHLTDADALHRLYVSEPLKAQTISGNITAQFQCLETFANDNLFLTLKVMVCNRAGSSFLATPLAITRDTTTELGTALANRNFPSTALSSYACADGDRLVIEVGLAGSISSGSGGVIGHNGSIRWGCNASSGDLPADDTQTGTTYRPWLENSVTLKWLADSDAAAAGTTGGTSACVALWNAAASAVGTTAGTVAAAFLILAVAASAGVATPAAISGQVVGAAGAASGNSTTAADALTVQATSAASTGTGAAAAASAAPWTSTASSAGLAAGGATGAAPYLADLASAGTATAAATASAVAASAGTSAGIGTPTATSSATVGAPAQAAGTATVLGEGQNAAQTGGDGDAEAQGTATSQATGAAIATTQAASTGSGQATGSSSAAIAGTAATTGTGLATGTAAASAGTSGTASGSTTAAATTSSIAATAASAAGAAISLSTGEDAGGVTGAAAGTSSATAIGRLSLRGYTRDGAGLALAGATVRIFRTADDTIAEKIDADGTGRYVFYVDEAGPFYAVAYLAGAPDRVGTTVNTLEAD